MTLPATPVRDVLDKGYVHLLDTMPGYGEIAPGYTTLDNAIVTAARTSFLGESKSVEADRRLLMRLWRDQHTSPFEMVELKYLVYAPVVVYWQWVRHRTFSFQSINSQSGRYTELVDDEEELHFPTVWRAQSASNKQASDGAIDAESGRALTDDLRVLYHDATRLYRKALAMGVAREQARLFLPGFSVYYRWIVKVDLLNLFHFLRLRLAGDAQSEIRHYAEAMFDILKPLAPWSCAAFEQSRSATSNT